MIVFPNAKINIGLNVIEKRQDGYHNLESCFLPIPWKDALEAVEAKEFSFSSSGIPIPGEENIVVQAYNMLNSQFGLPDRGRCVVDGPKGRGRVGEGIGELGNWAIGIACVLTDDV